MVSSGTNNASSSTTAESESVAAVWALVEDWLGSANYQHTLDCLRSEHSCVRFDSNRAFFPNPTGGTARKRSAALTAQLLASFDDGDAAAFEQAWNTHVPPSLSRVQQAAGVLPSRGDDEGSASQPSRSSSPFLFGGASATASSFSGGGWQTTRVRGLLLQVHAHFAVFLLRQRLLRFKRESSSSITPSASPCVTGSSLPRAESAELREPDLYPATLEERRALERFQRHLDDAATSSDAVALSSDRLLAPLFALPQHPRPWVHPGLAELLALDSLLEKGYAKEATRDNADGEIDGGSSEENKVSDDLLWSRMGSHWDAVDQQATHAYAAAAVAPPAGDCGSNRWVQRLRADLEELLSLRLLLVRPPALLVLHRTYVTWQSLLTVSLLKARRDADELRSISGALLGLAAQLLSAITSHAAVVTERESQNDNDGASGVYTWHQKALNNLRRKWEAHNIPLPEDPTAMALVQSLEGLHGTSVPTASSATRSNTPRVPGSFIESPQPLRRLLEPADGDFDVNFDIDAASSIKGIHRNKNDSKRADSRRGGGSGSPTLRASALRDFDDADPAFVPPPLDAARIGKHYLVLPPNAKAPGNSPLETLSPVVRASASVVLRAIGDRLSCRSWRVRQQTAEDVILGDLFSFFVVNGYGRNTSGGNGYGDGGGSNRGSDCGASERGVIRDATLPLQGLGKLLPLLRTSSNDDEEGPSSSSSPAVSSWAQALRVVALLSVRPGGRVYLLLSPRRSAVVDGLIAAVLKAASRHSTPRTHSNGASTAFGMEEEAAVAGSASACAALVQLLLHDPLPLESGRSCSRPLVSVERRAAEQGLLLKSLELLRWAVPKVSEALDQERTQGRERRGAGDGESPPAAVASRSANLALVDQAAALVLVLSKSAPTQLSCAEALTARESDEFDGNLGVGEEAKEQQDNQGPGNGVFWSGVIQSLLDLFTAASSSSALLAALRQSLVGALYCFVRSHPSLLMQAQTLGVGDRLHRSIAKQRAVAAAAALPKRLSPSQPSLSPLLEVDEEAFAMADLEWQAQCVGDFLGGADPLSMVAGAGGVVGRATGSWEARSLAQAGASPVVWKEEGDTAVATEDAFDEGEERRVVGHLAVLFYTPSPPYPAPPEHRRRFAHMESHEAQLGLAMEPALREFYLAAPTQQPR